MIQTPVTTVDAVKLSKAVWIGRVLSGLLCALFVVSAIGKVAGGEQAAEGMEHLGMPASLVTTLLIVELSCVVIYAIPQTAILGAILLTGYMGGAICAHLRIGDTPIVQVVIPMFVWLAMYLRDERVRKLIPIRSIGH